MVIGDNTDYKANPDWYGHKTDQRRNASDIYLIHFNILYRTGVFL